VFQQFFRNVINGTAYLYEFFLQNEEKRGLLKVAFSDKELSQSTAFD